jgi:DNA-binding MarR family transcriptional regulator
MEETGEEPYAGDLSYVEELLVQLTKLRRHSRYRQLLAEGTGFEASIATMRIIRAVEQLARSGQLPSIGELAERLGMEQANTSRAIDQAVERGLVLKRQSQSDGRRIEVCLTDTGQRAIRKLDARRKVVHKQLLASWSADEVSQLTTQLEKLCGSYEKLVL